MKQLSYMRSLFLISFLILFSGKTFSQLNQWTWIKGDNIINQAGIYGSAGISSITNKPGARSESASWKDNAGNFWLFGGIGYASGTSWGQLNDLWKYNPSTNQWVFIKGPQLPWGNGVYGTKGVSSVNNTPGSRLMSASWTDQAGNLWLFGGTGSSYFNDLWKYDIGTNQWTWVSGDNTGNAYGVYGTQGVASATSKPGARNNATCWADPAGNLWLYGGNGYAATGQGGRLGDLWKYNIESNTWTWMKGDTQIQSLSVYGNKNISSLTNKPGARTGASGWADQSGNLWLFGGLGYASVYGVLNDLWKYSSSTNEWIWMNGDSTVGHPAVYGNEAIVASANNTRPGAMHNAVAWPCTNGEVWLFGGRGYTNAAFGELNSLWKYNVSTNQFNFVKGDPSTFVAGEYGTLGVPAETNKPGAREKPIAWTDSIGNLWMFGGEGYPLNTTVTYYQNDLWKFSLIVPLPVKLISFEGKQQNQNILLNWQVESETGLDRYEVEKSFNGSVFQKTGVVKAMNLKSYDFTDHDANISGIIYYRLKMIDTDGKFIYSNVISFHADQSGGFVLYPNPANAYTQIRLGKNIYDKIPVEIRNAAGMLIIKNTYNVRGNTFIVSTNTLSPGTYSIVIVYNGERLSQNLMIVR